MNLENNPLINQMKKREESFWINDNVRGKLSDEITKDDTAEASKRLERFAPYLSIMFDGTDNGIIESPLKDIENMKALLSKNADASLNGRLMLKCDNLLPISGSIKARGGIYEVLCFAEETAIKAGLLEVCDNYSVLAEDRFKKLFSSYSIAVGSTGNLGLSIGIMGRALGFCVTVHMSSDAKQWKKDLLREKGATVVEYAGDYEKAVAQGRSLAEKDEYCHFVDDENSKTLFLGYSVAGVRLKAQLDEKGIAVTNDKPLFVYLPCGVGGGPGGVAYGLKQIFGENVRCFFGEPVEAPCMMLGVMTGLHDKISALDIGLSGKTIADGLAVTRPSSLVGRIVGNMLDGIYTVSDERMATFIKELYASEGIFAEPSATAGFFGYLLANTNKEYIEKTGVDKIKNGTHIVWATGGSMAPESERKKFL